MQERFATLYLHFEQAQGEHSKQPRSQRSIGLQFHWAYTFTATFEKFVWKIVEYHQTLIDRYSAIVYSRTVDLIIELTCTAPAVVSHNLMLDEKQG